MGVIKDRKSKGLTEVKEIKKRWQEYIEELYRKDLHDPENHDGVIRTDTHADTHICTHTYYLYVYINTQMQIIYRYYIKI